jgi:hypothetical protein
VWRTVPAALMTPADLLVFESAPQPLVSFARQNAGAREGVMLET